MIEAIKYARQVGAKVFGIVGRDGGYTAKNADVAVVIPTVNPATVTPHTEEFHGVLWHLIVSHPALKAHEMKWETVASEDGRSEPRTRGNNSTFTFDTLVPDSET